MNIDYMENVLFRNRYVIIGQQELNTLFSVCFSNKFQKIICSSLFFSSSIRPGVGKTTVMREIARVLADEFQKRVVC